MPDDTGGARTRDRQSMITIDLRPARANQSVTRTCVAEGVPSQKGLRASRRANGSVVGNPRHPARAETVSLTGVKAPGWVIFQITQPDPARRAAICRCRSGPSRANFIFLQVYAKAYRHDQHRPDPRRPRPAEMDPVDARPPRRPLDRDSEHDRERGRASAANHAGGDTACARAGWGRFLGRRWRGRWC